MTWGRGRETVERLLEEGYLERVLASPTFARRLLNDASAHLDSAGSIVGGDPTGSYQLAYDAARKACAALLAVQGLRATTRGGHIAVQDVVQEQFGKVFSSFAQMRRVRQTSEYPNPGTPTISAADAREGIGSATEILSAAGRLIDSDALTPFA